MNLEEVIAKVAKLPSFITDGDIECYYKYANLISNGLIVDLGTGWGKSMLSLALSNSTNQIITADPGIAPISSNWAKDIKDYVQKIEGIIEENNLKSNIIFFPISGEELLDKVIDKIDILHIDNWVEINQTDSTAFFKLWFSRVKDGGYLLIRNYGYGDREPYTKSVERAMEGLKKIEQMGLITVWQK